MANNALPLPFPYLPGEQKPNSFEDKTQQNFDAVALALGELLSASGLNGLRVVWGQISSAGAVLAGTPGITASRTGTGTYDIGFGTAFPTTPVVVVTAFRDSAHSGRGSAGFTEITYNAAGALTDAEFDWIAIGPR